MLLWAGGALMLAAAAFAIVAAAALPLPDVAQAGPILAEAGVDTADVPPLSAFEPAWRVDLRRPLNDAAPGDATAAGPAATGTGLRLVGTIIDGGSRPRGIFIVGAAAALELKAVGEKAGGAEVLSIDARSATVSIDGRPVILKLEKIDVLGVGDLPPVPPPSARSTGGAGEGS
jgi:hypothetical protein